MSKITILACALSLASIQAYPVARFGTLEEDAELTKRDGIQFTASSLFPSSQFVGSGFRHTTVFPTLMFSTGSRFNLLGMQPCGGVSGQPCVGASPQVALLPPQAVQPPAPQDCDPTPSVPCVEQPQQTPPQVVPPPIPQDCDPTPSVPCVEQLQQAPPQEMPPQQAPPQVVPPPVPQDCDPTPSVPCVEQPQQAPPQEMPPQQAPPQVVPPPAPQDCDQAQGQACASGPTAFNFGNSQNKDVKMSSYKETTLYYNQKDAKSASKSASSSTQLNYTKI
ncbi:hypothetical protein GGI20_004281 [Coemansia sp. BCRC 34301]|nr:hypothetical protein GGI20_004281 [Coemansia sp. BCRC 34301]